jgi:hypothetical protein
VAAIVGVLLASAVGVQDARAASILLVLHPDGTLEAVLDSGVRIRPSTTGAVIPPGVYAAVVQSDVPEFRDDYHMFHLTGPGVNLQTDLLAGDERAEPHSVTFLPNSTYVFQDDRNAGLGRVTFTTSGPATAVAQSSGGSPASSSSGAGKTSSQGVKNVDLVGSAMPTTTFRGTLNGGVDTRGKLALTFKGKAVSSLKSGRYRIVVLDETSTSSFNLNKLGRKPVKVTGRPFVGRQTATLTLAPGQWMFYSTPAKKKYFVVVR